jgi:hypothetical protein
VQQIQPQAAQPEHPKQLEMHTLCGICAMKNPRRILDGKAFARL